MVTDLAAIVEHCLELDPARRYQSADEVRRDLWRRRRGLPLQARPHTFAYVAGRFAVRHAVLLLAFLVIVSVQSLQVTTRLSEAQAHAQAHLQQEVLHAFRHFQLSETDRYDWLDVLVRSQADDAGLRQVLRLTDYATWLDTLRDIVDVNTGNREKNLLLVLTDPRGRVLVRTDQATGAVANLPAVRAVLQEPDRLSPAHGYWQVGDNLYQVSAVPLVKGDSLEFVLMAGQQITNHETLMELPGGSHEAESDEDSLSYASADRVFASTWDVLGAASYLKQEAAAGAGVHEIGHRYLTRFVPLQGYAGSHPAGVVVTVDEDAELSPLRRLQASYVAQALGGLLLGGALLGLILYRSEAVMGRST
ncbi:MAG: serine/threonine-protein kinase [Candidatus Xenobia bacterium]